MPARRASASSQQVMLQIKVTLLGTKPPIWRRVAVPAAMKLPKFHLVLQSVMGWSDCHLHAFRVGDRRFELPSEESLPAFGFFPAVAEFDERKFRVRDLFAGPGGRAHYDYDFGDSWEHELKLEKTLSDAPKGMPPVCFGGARACPPEDCGGIPGFYHFLEAIADPKHPDHDRLRAWYGGDFDPEFIDPAAIDAQLRHIKA